MASLVVDTLVLITFSAMALGEFRGILQVGLLLILLATLIVWSSGIVLYLVSRAGGLIGTLMRRIGYARPSRSGKSGIWDAWLDIPDPYHP